MAKSQKIKEELIETPKLILDPVAINNQRLLNDLTVFAEEQTLTNTSPRFKSMIHDIIANVTSLREYALRRSMSGDPRRDIDDECGLTKSPTPQYLFELFRSNPFANRAVEVLPKESWEVQPDIHEDKDNTTFTQFEQALLDLDQELSPEKSYYAEQKGSKIFEILERLDILSQAGSYGVLFFGLDDANNLDLSKPVKVSKGRKINLRYLTVLPEAFAMITKWDTNQQSPRYGKPLEYLLTFNAPGATSSTSYLGLGTSAISVHYTRVLHIAPNVYSNESLGNSILYAISRIIESFPKILYAGAESYYKGGFPGIALETQPQAAGVPVDWSKIKDEAENYMNGLQRYIGLQNMTAKTLEPNLTDPSPYVKILVEALCVYLAIPVRIFMGSERGQLASSQDDSTWNDRKKHRQQKYITPKIIVPFIDKCINLNILPVPKKSYCIEWSSVETENALTKAQVAQLMTQAMSTYVQSGLNTLIDPITYFTTVWGFDQETALSIQEQLNDYQLENPDEYANDDELDDAKTIDDKQIDDKSDKQKGDKQDVKDKGTLKGKPKPTNPKSSKKVK